MIGTSPATMSLFSNAALLLSRAGLPDSEEFLALVLDTETGGVFEDEDGGYQGSANRYGLTQIGLALVRVSLNSLIPCRILSSPSERFVIDVPPMLELTDEALAVQGHTLDSWREMPGKRCEADAMPWFSAWQDIAVGDALKYSLPLYLVGHNLEFHLAFLEALASRTGTSLSEMPLWSGASRWQRIDTMLAFRALREQGLFPGESSASLRGIAAELFQSRSRINTIHDAERDALVCARVLGELCQRAIKGTVAGDPA